MVCQAEKVRKVNDQDPTFSTVPPDVLHQVFGQYVECEVCAFSFLAGSVVVYQAAAQYRVEGIGAN